MIEENRILQKKLWSSLGPSADSVLSTRVRLARNITGIPFPHLESSPEAGFIFSLFEKHLDLFQQTGYSFVKLKDLDYLQKRFLRERNIITFEMEKSDKSAVLFNDTEGASVLINEEDHIRVQVIRPGLQLREVFEQANCLDDELNGFIPYSFSCDYGYLTACPSNLGTGLKVSFMLHLPALTIKKAIPDLSLRLKNEGAVIKGMIEKSVRSPGNIYHLANTVSLGLSEVDIIELMDGIVSRIIYLEDEAKDELISHSRVEIEDAVWRSLGILTSARRMRYTEAMEHLSNIRLGIILAFFKNISLIKINNLMVEIQLAHLQKITGCSFLAGDEADETRARYLRANFNILRHDDV